MSNQTKAILTELSALFLFVGGALFFILVVGSAA